MVTSIDKLPQGDYKFTNSSGTHYVHVGRNFTAIDREVIHPEELHNIALWEEEYPTEYIPI